MDEDFFSCVVIKRKKWAYVAIYNSFALHHRFLSPLSYLFSFFLLFYLPHDFTIVSGSFLFYLSPLKGFMNFLKFLVGWIYNIPFL